MKAELLHVLINVLLLGGIFLSAVDVLGADISILKDDCGCLYEDRHYSVGAIICIDGSKYRCEGKYDSGKKRYVGCRWEMRANYCK